MSENIETGLVVDSVTTKDSGDKSGVAVVMKGQKTVTHDIGNGYTTEDTVEITLTFKLGAMITAKKLGIDQYNDAKVITLRDRDESLQSFGKVEVELHPAMREKLA